jgi:hypothetical protein
LGIPRGERWQPSGHVDLTWTSSFQERPAAANVRNIGPFAEVLARLMDGYPVGAAMGSINRRYVEIASEFLGDLRATKTTRSLEDRTAHFETYEARNFVILGDPAVSLVTEAGDVPEMPNSTTLSPAAAAGRPARRSGSAPRPR